MQAKKSPRKAFSCMPTRPVAGEALSLHLSRQHMHAGKQGHPAALSAGILVTRAKHNLPPQKERPSTDMPSVKQGNLWGRQLEGIVI